MSKQKGNVAPGLIGKRVRFCQCPNVQVSEQLATVQGSYVEDGRVVLVLEFDSGHVGGYPADFVTTDLKGAE